MVSATSSAASHLSARSCSAVSRSRGSDLSRAWITRFASGNVAPHRLLVLSLQGDVHAPAKPHRLLARVERVISPQGDERRDPGGPQVNLRSRVAQPVGVGAKPPPRSSVSIPSSPPFLPGAVIPMSATPPARHVPTDPWSLSPSGPWRRTLGTGDRRCPPPPWQTQSPPASACEVPGDPNSKFSSLTSL